MYRKRIQLDRISSLAVPSLCLLSMRHYRERCKPPPTHAGGFNPVHRLRLCIVIVPIALGGYPLDLFAQPLGIQSFYRSKEGKIA
jgi:hypothetical protein